MADKADEVGIAARLTVAEIRALLQRASTGAAIIGHRPDSAAYLSGVGKLARNLPEYVEGGSTPQAKRESATGGSKA